MPTPDQLQALSDAGGFVLFLFVVFAAAIGLWRGWWVPGPIAFPWLHRAEAAESENRTLLVTIARLTAELQAARKDQRERRRGGVDDRA